MVVNNVLQVVTFHTSRIVVTISQPSKVKAAQNGVEKKVLEGNAVMTCIHILAITTLSLRRS
jgi:hypothetical protein